MELQQWKLLHSFSFNSNFVWFDKRDLTTNLIYFFLRDKIRWMMIFIFVYYNILRIDEKPEEDTTKPDIYTIFKLFILLLS